MTEPQQGEEGSEYWAVHRPSQGSEQMSQSQVNAFVIVIFCTCFALNSLFDFGESRSKTAETAEIESWIVVFALTVMTAVQVILIVKMRECIVWPEEVGFRRDGLMVLQMGCGQKVLDTSNGGVTILKRRHRWWTGLGVWTNAITDKSREEVFVLVPTHGPRYWKGFAFQPEDQGAFLHDCGHAGILFDGGESNVYPLGVVSNRALARRLLANRRRLTDVEDGMVRNQQSNNRSTRSGSFELSSQDDNENNQDDESDVDAYSSEGDDEVLSPMEDDTEGETKRAGGDWKWNNNIVEV